MLDVLVVGGGPAGLATALYAARAGLDVAVLDRRRTSAGDKACGEGLMPTAVRALRELGIDPPGPDITGITYRNTASVAVAQFNREPGRGVRRTVLHEELRTAIRAYRVPVREATVNRIEQGPEQVRAGGLAARWLVAADGLHSPVRRSLEPDRTLMLRRRRPRRWGLRRHYAVAPWTDTVEVTWGQLGEAYVTPVGPQTVGVVMLSQNREHFDTQLAGFPRLQHRLIKTAQLSSDRGAGPLHQPVPQRMIGRVFLVGDAAGYLDAMTGEGISVALASARVLVECLAAGRPERYEQEWRRVSRPYRAITSALLWARHRPLLARSVVPAAARFPAAFAATVNRLGG